MLDTQKGLCPVSSKENHRDPNYRFNYFAIKLDKALNWSKIPTLIRHVCRLQFSRNIPDTKLIFCGKPSFKLWEEKNPNKITHSSSTGSGGVLVFQQLGSERKKRKQENPWCTQHSFPGFSRSRLLTTFESGNSHLAQIFLFALQFRFVWSFVCWGKGGMGTAKDPRWVVLLGDVSSFLFALCLCLFVWIPVSLKFNLTLRVKQNVAKVQFLKV